MTDVHVDDVSSLVMVDVLFSLTNIRLRSTTDEQCVVLNVFTVHALNFLILGIIYTLSGKKHFRHFRL